MPAVSALFLVLSLALAVVLGPQTHPWSWGPAMISLGIAALTSIPAFWKSVRQESGVGILLLCVATALWYAWRAWNSPVKEFGLTELFLLCGAVGAFVSIRGISGNVLAERIVIWGIALLVLANMWVVGRQLFAPPFSPLFPLGKDSVVISGFYAHYNHLANFLIGSSMLLGAAALFGRHAIITRLFLALLTIAGLAGVYYSKSRGGILGAAVGCGVFLVLALVLAKRRNSKWFAPGLLAIPLFCMAVAMFWIFGWEQRSGGDTLGLLDNTIRLYLVGIALSCIGLHPLMGGGSQSFSWESFRFFDGKIQRHAGYRPEMVHNELIQSATDYGFIGAGLLIALLVVLLFACTLRVAFEDRPREPDWRDAWRLGAMAGLVGMLVQSSFSFVFHLMPDVILLGICMGMMSRGESRMPNFMTRTASVFVTIAALCSAAILFPAGWKGTRIYQAIGPVVFGKVPSTAIETRIDALTQAIQIWPLSEFYQERAALHLAFSGPAYGVSQTEAMQFAIQDYLLAHRQHPYEPSHVINAANLQSKLGMDLAAEDSYARGIQLQGGLESGFRGHFSKAKHHLSKGARLSSKEDDGAALAEFEIAATEIEQACEEMHWLIGDMNEPRLIIHTYLGNAREAAGDFKGALAAYDFATTLQQGKAAHHLAGSLIGKMAVEAWKQRKPEKALGAFMEARRRVNLAAGQLPQGITAEDRTTYLAYLDEMIAFLQGAKVKPAAWPPADE